PCSDIGSILDDRLDFWRETPKASFVAMRTEHFFYLVLRNPQADLWQIKHLPFLHHSSRSLLEILSAVLTALWAMHHDRIALLAQLSAFSSMSLLSSALAPTRFSSTVRFALEPIT